MQPRQRGRPAHDDHPRPRAAALPGVGRAVTTLAMHGRRDTIAARECDVIFCNSQFTAADVRERLGVPEDRLRVAYPGLDPALPARGRGGRPSARRTCCRSRPTSRARTWSTAVEAIRILRARGSELELALVGQAGWGDQMAPEPGIRRLGYRPAGELPALYRGAAAVLLPVAVRGLRHARWSRRWRAGRRPVCSTDPSLDEAAGEVALRAAADDAGGVRRCDRAGGRQAPTTCATPGCGTRRASPAAPAARRCWRRSVSSVKMAACPDPRLRGAIDVSPLALTRAGTARYVDQPARRAARLGQARTAARCRSTAPAGWRRSPRDVLWYPAVLPVQAARARVDVLHCTTIRAPLVSRVPVVVTVHDVAPLRRPDAFNAWTRRTRRSRCGGSSLPRPP